MRDIGIFVWVVLLVIGVIGSMVSSLRKASQAQKQGQGQSQSQLRTPPRPVELREARLPDWAQQFVAAMPQQPQQAPAPPARPAPPPKAKAARAPAPPPMAEHDSPRHRRGRFFDGRSEIVRAVIAAEVLGKPRAFNDEYFGR